MYKINFRSILKKINRFFLLVGLSLNNLKNLIFIFQFIGQKREWIKQGGEINENYVILSDYKENAGVIKGHYFHQDLLVSGFIFENKPKRHIDISSRIDGSSDIDIFRRPTLIDETMWAKSVKCWITGSDFTTFNRQQHHCRHCGRSVSNARSSRTFNLVDKSGTPHRGERVCDFCYTILNGGKPTWQFSSTKSEIDKGGQPWNDYMDDDEGNGISDQITGFVINNPVGKFPVTINRSGYNISPYEWKQFRQDNPERWRWVMLKEIEK